MGFATDPAAMTGAGLGVPVTSPALVAAGFSQSTTGAVSSVKIDGAVQDIAVDAYGNEEGMCDAAQCVLIAFGTVRGEIATQPEAGVQWPSKLGDNAVQLVYEQARQVMAPLTTRGIAELVDVAIETRGTALYGVVTWRDLRTGELKPLDLPIG